MAHERGPEKVNEKQVTYLLPQLLTREGHEREPFAYVWHSLQRRDSEYPAEARDEQAQRPIRVDALQEWGAFIIGREGRYVHAAEEQEHDRVHDVRVELAVEIASEHDGAMRTGELPPDGERGDVYEELERERQ